MMSLELKVKACSLAAEAAIIRRIERKRIKAARTLASGNCSPDRAYSDYHSLRAHRVLIVRPEARATHLARGFLSGLPYQRIETGRKDAASRPNLAHERRATLENYILPRVADMVMKYSSEETGGRPLDVSTQDWNKARKQRVIDRLKGWSRLLYAEDDSI